MQYGVFLPVSIIPDCSADHPPAFAGRRLRPDLVCRGDDRRDGEWALSIPRWVSTSSCSEHRARHPLAGPDPWGAAIRPADCIGCRDALSHSLNLHLVANLVMGPPT